MSDLHRRSRLETWLDRQLIELFRGQVLPVTHPIAKRRGAFDSLREIMIAATAFEHGLTLVTRNVKDFDHLSLTIINPWQSA